MEKAFAEIAPRRSPVRARLAPYRKGLQMRPFLFRPRNRMSAPWSSVGQRTRFGQTGVRPESSHSGGWRSGYRTAARLLAETVPVDDVSAGVRAIVVFMAGSALILTYCASGPYRHVTELLRQKPNAWFPWGYRLAHVADPSELKGGTAVELWEIDDTRRPSRAHPVAAGRLDLVQRTSEYVALTVRCNPGKAKADEESVLRGVAEGRMVFSVLTGRPREPVPAVGRSA